MTIGNDPTLPDVLREMFSRAEAKVVESPGHDGDGYSWGGDIILVIGDRALNLGTASGSREIAREIARRWNAAKP